MTRDMFVTIVIAVAVAAGSALGAGDANGDRLDWLTSASIEPFDASPTTLPTDRRQESILNVKAGDHGAWPALAMADTADHPASSADGGTGAVDNNDYKEGFIFPLDLYIGGVLISPDLDGFTATRYTIFGESEEIEGYGSWMPTVRGGIEYAWERVAVKATVGGGGFLNSAFGGGLIRGDLERKKTQAMP